MSQPSDKPAPQKPRPAASIVMLRDGPAGIEVFMVERHQGAGAFAGALVFPGGKVDDEDRAHWPNLTVPAGGPEQGFWVASVRETFEEAGILLARSAGGGDIVGGDHASRLVAEARSGRDGKPLGFVELLDRERLVPALDALVHFGHWITPLWAPRRFDTHFFLIGAPAGQRAVLDEGESAAGTWMRPGDVLADADQGRHSLVAVTRFTLELLTTWGNVAEALAGARKRTIVTVLPVREKTEAGLMLRIPEEAGYPRHEMLVT